MWLKLDERNKRNVTRKKTFNIAVLINRLFIENIGPSKPATNGQFAYFLEIQYPSEKV